MKERNIFFERVRHILEYDDLILRNIKFHALRGESNKLISLDFKDSWIHGWLLKVTALGAETKWSAKA